MYKKGLLPCSIKHACRLLSQDKHADNTGLLRRLRTAPHDAYLAIDIFTSEHQGWKIEGLNKYYNGNSVTWGLSFADATLVWTDKEKSPYPLGFKSHLYKEMGSNQYRSLTPSELMLELTRKTNKALRIKAVVFDGGITARPALKELKEEKIPFVGRIKTTNTITFQEREMSIKNLAQEFRPGIARWYKNLKCYAKRVKIKFSDVGEADLVIIWWEERKGNKLSVLVSTLETEVQEVIKVHKARWQDEVSHRLLKQSFGFEACQCQTYAAQLKHADLCLDAFHQVRAKKEEHLELSWREVQELYCQGFI